VVIGEGERTRRRCCISARRSAPAARRWTSRVDPLEGTTLTAKGGPNALATIAMAEARQFLNAPDIYMDKIAVGGGLPEK
jgi:fructose-1,6-bisphosphatase II / sedoheptulose-1,7-bisphosphatase